MIREFQILDTEQVMKLWFWGNVDAHPFVSEEYWHSHFNEVQEDGSVRDETGHGYDAIPDSKSYTWIEEVRCPN